MLRWPIVFALFSVSCGARTSLRQGLFAPADAGDPHGNRGVDAARDARPMADAVDDSTGPDASVGVGFGPAIENDVRRRVDAIAVADFDGDGRLDVVGGNTSGGVPAIRVYLGNGDGTLQAPLEYLTGKVANSIATGDFRGIGVIDLAVSVLSPDQVSWLLGQGNGTFPTVGRYALPVGPAAIVTADFNNDRKLDMCAYGVDGAVSVFLGNGDGTFQTPITSPPQGFSYGPFGLI